MTALLYKDLVALRKTVRLIGAVLAVVCFIGIRQGAALMLPFVFVLVPVILLGVLFGSDAQSKADTYIIPGPVKRSTIVLSRYTFVWLLVTVGIFFTLLLKLLIGAGPLQAVPWHLLAAGMALLVSFFAAIQLPLMYKFGAEQGRLLFVILYFIIFALFTWLGGKKDSLLDFIGWLKGSNLGLLSLAIIVVTLVVNVVSWLISTAIYTRKAF